MCTGQALVPHHRRPVEKELNVSLELKGLGRRMQALHRMVMARLGRLHTQPVCVRNQWQGLDALEYTLFWCVQRDRMQIGSRSRRAGSQVSTSLRTASGHKFWTSHPVNIAVGCHEAEGTKH